MNNYHNLAYYLRNYSSQKAPNETLEDEVNRLYVADEVNHSGILLIGEFVGGVAVWIYLSVKPVDACRDTMTAENSKTHRVYTMNAVHESGKLATYGKAPPSNVVRRPK